MKRFLLILWVFSLFSFDNFNETELSGSYVSGNPNKSEKKKIMYSKGYYNFLFTDSNEVVLKLNKDKTFTFSRILCKAGNKTWKGTWEYKDEKIYLDFSDPKKTDFEFVKDNNLLYRITDINIKGDSRLKKSLCLLRKQ